VILELKIVLVAIRFRAAFGIGRKTIRVSVNGISPNHLTVCLDAQQERLVGAGG